MDIFLKFYRLWEPIWSAHGLTLGNPFLWAGMVIVAIMLLPLLVKSGNPVFATIRKRMLWLMLMLPLPLAAIGFFAPLVFGFGGNQGPLLFLFAPAYTLPIAPIMALLLGGKAVWGQKSRPARFIYMALLGAVLIPWFISYMAAPDIRAAGSNLPKPEWMRLHAAAPVTEPERELLRSTRLSLRLGIENSRFPVAYTNALLADLKARPLFDHVAVLAEMAEQPDLIASIENRFWGNSQGAEFLVWFATKPEKKLRVAVHYEIGSLLTQERDRQQYLDRLAIETIKAIRQLQAGNGVADGKSTSVIVRRAAMATLGTGTFNPRLALVNGERIVVAASSAFDQLYYLIGVAFDGQGLVDKSWGDAGSTRMWFESAYSKNSAHAAVLTTAEQGGDGAIIVGELLPRPSEPHVPFVARFDLKGEDHKFGYDSATRFAIRYQNDVPTGVAVQPDGKLVFSANSGRQDTPAGQERSDIVVLRFASDGRGYDATFGRGGTTIETGGTTGNDRAGPVAIAPDGKVILAGQMDTGTNAPIGKAILIRYLGNGKRDHSFGSSGKLNLEPEVRIESLIIQRDGRILLNGESRKYRARILSRLMPDGQADISFGYAGHVVLPYGEGRSVIAEQTDGKILVLDGLATGQAHRQAVRLVRRNVDGSPDLAFGNQGQVILELDGRAFWPGDLRATADGRILVAGMRNSSPTTRPVHTEVADILVVRLDAAGLVDKGFGSTLQTNESTDPVSGGTQDQATAAEAPNRHGFGSIKDAAWDKHQFVVVGDSGIIATSPDGITWTVRRSGPAEEKLTAVAWGKDRFVTMGVRNLLLTSYDGINWSKHEKFDNQSRQVNRISWIDGQFFAVGSQGLLMSSTDGTVWNQQSVETKEDIVGIAGSTGKLVAVSKFGSVLTSVDGKVWSSLGPRIANFLSNVAWSGQEFVAVGNLGYGGVVGRSSDGMHWMVNEFSGYHRLLEDVAWTGRLFLAVGSDILISADGQSWEFLNARMPVTGYQPKLKRVIANGTPYLAIGSGLLWSFDGRSWSGAQNARFGAMGMATPIAGGAVSTTPIVEAREIKEERKSEAQVQLLMSLVMAGAGLVPYFALQYLAIRRIKENWRRWKLLPAYLVAIAAVVTVIGYLAELPALSGALPLTIFGVNVYLVLILITDAAQRKFGTPSLSDESSTDEG